MLELPPTTTKLLDRLRAGDDADQWREIDARYRPVLRGFAASLGLPPADAEDAAQWTLAEVARMLRSGDYRRERGRLRAWIFGIARHRVQMLQRAAARRRRAEAADPTPDLPDESSLSILWERETQRAIFHRAWEAVRSSGLTSETNLRAFELVVLRGLPADAAAAQCGLSVDAVYTAKSRILRRLRELSAELARGYSDDE